MIWLYLKVLGYNNSYHHKFSMIRFNALFLKHLHVADSFVFFRHSVFLRPYGLYFSLRFCIQLAFIRSVLFWPMRPILKILNIFNFNVENVIIRGCKWNETVSNGMCNNLYALPRNNALLSRIRCCGLMQCDY
jgi:hypothetical protein